MLDRNFILSLIITTNIVISIPYSQKIISAESPSFNIQEIIDPRTDWINMDTRQYDHKNGERSTDILAVNYYSDGKVLNATLWLYFDFKVIPNYTMVNYGMYIDADFKRETGYGGIDYQLEIAWNNDSKTWTKTLEAWSPNGSQRTIDIESNYTGFFEEEKKYVIVSLNLSDIHSPPKYKVAFYAESKKEKDDALLTDISRFIAIPPLQLAISTSPNSIELRKQEEKTIEVKISSTQGYEPTVKIYTRQVQNIDFEFKQNDTLRIPSYGEATTPLTIKASPNAYTGPYTLFLYANSTFPPEELISMLATNESSIPPLMPENIFTQSSILLTIQESLSWIEKVNEFWNKLGSPISFIYGILAGISPWIYERIRKLGHTRRDNKPE